MATPVWVIPEVDNLKNVIIPNYPNIPINQIIQKESKL